MAISRVGGLLSVLLTGLLTTACDSNPNAVQEQVLITVLEVKKAALGRCQKEIKEITGVNAYAPTTEKMNGTELVTLTWKNHQEGFKTAECIFELNDGLLSLTIDGRTVFERS